mmetsp:Transcript_135382/g.235427  ORF Transcript_135382/g.235427 Transcript_135382/m.235427 type:complete len:94 (-) Transcript_135382:566-847(-)
MLGETASGSDECLSRGAKVIPADAAAPVLLAISVRRQCVNTTIRQLPELTCPARRTIQQKKIAGERQQCSNETEYHWPHLSFGGSYGMMTDVE